MAFDELFLTDISPDIAGNWIYTGLGYRITKPVAMQAGYARQYNYSASAVGYKDFIVASFLLSLTK